MGSSTTSERGNHPVSRMIQVGVVSAPKAPFNLAECGIDREILQGLALKLAYSVQHFTTECPSPEHRFSSHRSRRNPQSLDGTLGEGDEEDRALVRMNLNRRRRLVVVAVRSAGVGATCDQQGQATEENVTGSAAHLSARVSLSPWR